MSVSEKYLLIPEGLEGERLDVGLSRLLGISRTKAAQLIDNHLVLIESRAPLSRSERLEAGLSLAVTLPEEKDLTQIAPEIVEGMEIVYEDADIVVVNKPVGVAAHPSVGWEGPSVLSGLLGAGVQITTSGAQERRGIVSRLDVGTSGLMVVAKSELAYSVLKNAFRNRQVEKKYHAICQGHPDPLKGTIDAPIARSQKHDYKYAVMKGGKASITQYEVIEMFNQAALIDIKLLTGRTHQIRVHFSALGHPLIGDPLYGSNPKLATELKLERQWLHAKELGFEHPATRKWVNFTADYSNDLKASLKLLRGN